MWRVWSHFIFLIYILLYRCEKSETMFIKYWGQVFLVSSEAIVTSFLKLLSFLKLKIVIWEEKSSKRDKEELSLLTLHTIYICITILYFLIFVKQTFTFWKLNFKKNTFLLYIFDFFILVKAQRKTMGYLLRPATKLDVYFPGCFMERLCVLYLPGAESSFKHETFQVGLVSRLTQFKERSRY